MKKIYLNCLTYDYDPWSYPKNWFRNIRQFFRNLKYAWQRITKGYCDRDIWSLDHYYSDLFYVTLNQLADTAHGYPGTGEFADNVAKEAGFIDEEYGCHGAVRWEAYLKEMAEHFYNCQEYHDDVPMNAKPMQCYEEMDKYRSDMKFEPIPGENMSRLTYDIYDTIKYNRANKRWMKAELKAVHYRDAEKDKAFDMMKKYFFNLWD